MQRTMMMAALLACTPAKAQETPPPRAATPAIIEDPRVSLWGYGSPRPRGVLKPLRSAMAANDVTSWLPAGDPAVVAFLADPQASASVSMRLTIDAAGRVIACAENLRWRDDPPPAFTDGLCDRVSVRARFTPAIDDAGVRVGRAVARQAVDRSLTNLDERCNPRSVRVDDLLVEIRDLMKKG